MGDAGSTPRSDITGVTDGFLSQCLAFSWFIKEEMHRLLGSVC